LREEFSGFDVVEDRKRLAGFDPVSNLRPDFHDSSTRQRANYSDPAINRLDSSGSPKVLVQLRNCGRGDGHPDVLLRGNTSTKLPLLADSACGSPSF